jgi:hypothetical protein
LFYSLPVDETSDAYRKGDDMKIVEVKCDQCSRDLTTTHNIEDWRLVLKSEAKMPYYVAEGSSTSPVTLMGIKPPVDRTHHFCGLRCLANWMHDKHPEHTESLNRQPEPATRVTATITPGEITPSDLPPSIFRK